MKQTNSYTSLNSYGQAQTAPGVYGSMATGFPAPLTVTIPTNGLIVANTAGLLAQNIASYIPLDYHEGYIAVVEHGVPAAVAQELHLRSGLRRQPHRPRARSPTT